MGRIILAGWVTHLGLIILDRRISPSGRPTPLGTVKNAVIVFSWGEFEFS